MQRILLYLIMDTVYRQIGFMFDVRIQLYYFVTESVSIDRAWIGLDATFIALKYIVQWFNVQTENRNGQLNRKLIKGAKGLTFHEIVVMQCVDIDQYQNQS